MEKESESDPDLVVNMIYKLETGADYMSDLVSVLKDLGKEYRYEDIDKDKYYDATIKGGQTTSGGGMIGGTNKPIPNQTVGKKMAETGIAGSGTGSKVLRNPTSKWPL